jgi:hypothetical protein
MRLCAAAAATCSAVLPSDETIASAAMRQQLLFQRLLTCSDAGTLRGKQLAK